MPTPIFCDVGELWEVHDTPCDSNCNYCTCTAGHSRFCRYWNRSSKPELPAAFLTALDRIEDGSWDRLLVRLNGAIQFRKRAADFKEPLIGADDDS